MSATDKNSAGKLDLNMCNPQQINDFLNDFYYSLILTKLSYMVDIIKRFYTFFTIIKSCVEGA